VAATAQLFANQKNGAAVWGGKHAKPPKQFFIASALA
jgi:hypothetical protein